MIASSLRFLGRGQARKTVQVCPFCRKFTEFKPAYPGVIAQAEKPDSPLAGFYEPDRALDFRVHQPVQEGKKDTFVP